MDSLRTRKDWVCGRKVNSASSILPHLTRKNNAVDLAQRIARFKPRKEALNLPVIDMSALADTVVPGVGFKDGAR